MRLSTQAAALLVAYAGLISPVSAFAQEVPKLQGGGGYIYVDNRWTAFTGPITPDTGTAWFGRVVINGTPHIGAIGEFSGNYFDAYGHKGIKGSARFYSVLGGLKFTPFCCRAVSPFAHALAGTVRSSFKGLPEQTSAFDTIENHFALAFGGGVDIHVLHVTTDLMRVTHPSDFNAWTLRFAAGVMLPGR